MNNNLRVERSLPHLSRNSQHGFGLIEVLVALLILAIGLLGMASLQTASLQQTTGSQARTQAIFLAEDLVERIRANRPNRAAYQLGEENALNCDTEFTLDGASVVANDIREWRNSLACLLPGGNGEVTVNGELVTVDITWNLRREFENLDEGDLAWDEGELTLEVAL